MTSAKLSGSLLVYKDLPSAMAAQRVSPPNGASDEQLPVGRFECAEATARASNDPVTATVAAAPLASSTDARGRRFSPIIHLGLAGWGIAATTAAALFFFSHTNGQTTATIATVQPLPGPPIASAAERMQTDRIAQPPSTEVVSATAAPEPAPGRQPAEEGVSVSAAQPILIVAAATAEPVPTGASAISAIPSPSLTTAASTPISSAAEVVAAGYGPVQPAAVRLPAEELAGLRARGDTLFGNGDIASARLFYERAAEGGDAQSSLRLAETYDAAFLVRAGLGGVRGDLAMAARWYRQAQALGAAEAEILLSLLTPVGDAAIAGK